MSLTLGACTVDDGFGPAPATAKSAPSDPPYTATTLAELAGSFDLTMDASSSTFVGEVFAHVAPTEAPWILSRKDNGCILYESQVDFCQPACTGNLVCSGQHACVLPPTAQNLGAIHLSGVGSTAIDMNEFGGQYTPDADLPFPPCADGDDLQIDVDGNKLPGFSLSTKCVDALKFDAAIKYVRQTALKLTWGVAATASAPMRVTIDLGSPSNTRGKIVCDIEDTGTVTVSADIMELLIKLGAIATPVVTLTRIANGGTVMGDPRNVAFTMQTSVTREFQIPQVTCAVNTDCDAKKTCQASKLCL